MAMSWWTQTRDASIGHAVFQLVAASGVDGVSMRAIARTSRMALGTVGNHYRSKPDLLAVAAREIGQRHLDDLFSRTAVNSPLPERLAGLVARDEQELTEMRVWYDLVAAGRSLPEVGAVTSIIDSRFRDVLGQALPEDTGRGTNGLPPLADRVWLLIQAVRLEQVRPGSVLTTEQAAALCRAHRIGAPPAPVRS